jgi:hypothetical protein
VERGRKRRELPSFVRKEVWLVAEEADASFAMNKKPSTRGKKEKLARWFLSPMRGWSGKGVGPSIVTLVVW